MPASPILPDAAIEEMLNELATELDAAQESPVDVEEVCRPMSAKETRQRVRSGSKETRSSFRAKREGPSTPRQRQDVRLQRQSLIQ